jgi:hypothetical protein
MARYRIVCTTQEPVAAPRSHQHIVKVGTGEDSSRASRDWTLAQVVAALDAAETFYTKGTQSGKEATVSAVSCPACGHRIIRSAADAVADNNLDNLRTCNWA